MSRPVVLLIGALPESVERTLEASYSVFRVGSLEEVAQQSAARLSGVGAVVTGGGTGLNAEAMASMPLLGHIAVNGVGLDRVDLGAAKSRGIRVTTTPGVLAEDVAELAMAFIVNLSRDFVARDRFVREGGWQRDRALPLTRRIAGRRLGVLGLGHIGLAIATRAEAFGMQISYHNRRARDDVRFSYYSTPVELAAASEMLVVAVQGGADTRGLVDRSVLDALGSEGVLINVARGSVVDETALIDAIQEGRIAKAGLDVFENEPFVPLELRASDKVLLQPHQGSATIEARQAMGEMIVQALAGHFSRRDSDV